MIEAPIPLNEKERMLAVMKLGLLDTTPEKRFDRITTSASRIFGVPISTLTIVDSKREWFKSVCGLDKTEGDRAISFCGHALLSDRIFVIEDTFLDERFKDNPMVIGEPFIRFYAGVPVMSADGQRVGVFCIKDKKPRKFSEEDKNLLISLASWAELEINSKNLSDALSLSKSLAEELNVIFDLSKDLIFVANMTGYLERANKSASDILGFTGEELLAKPYIEFFDQSDMALVKNAIAEILKTGGLTNFVGKFNRKKGGYVWLKWNVFIHNGKIYAYATDLTALKDKEQQLIARTDEAEKLNRLAVDRELKMVELKQRIAALEGTSNKS